jgi:hypothetical protein
MVLVNPVAGLYPYFPTRNQNLAKIQSQTNFLTALFCADWWKNIFSLVVLFTNIVVATV